MLKNIAGLSAALVLVPALAHAEPVARWGATVYPPRPVAEAAPATVAPAPVSQAPTEVFESRRSRRHHMAMRGRRALREAAATPIETPPAPTPADAKPKSGPTDNAGPHEGPAPTIHDLVTKHARENGVPENLASAVVGIESRFNPNARGGSALGLMQIQYATARANGFSGSARGLLEPETNLRFGMKVLADAYKSSRGDICLTLAKYQSGHLTTHISATNRAYCARARALMAKA